jgi:hypothetical protein
MRRRRVQRTFTGTRRVQGHPDRALAKWTIVANRTESRGRLRGVRDQSLKTSL